MIIDNNTNITVPSKGMVEVQKSLSEIVKRFFPISTVKITGTSVGDIKRRDYK